MKNLKISDKEQTIFSENTDIKEPHKGSPCECQHCGKTFTQIGNWKHIQSLFILLTNHMLAICAIKPLLICMVLDPTPLFTHKKGYIFVRSVKKPFIFVIIKKSQASS